MKSSEEQERIDKQWFNKIYAPMYTNGTHTTEFDGETLPAIYDKIAQNILAGKSVTTLAQAVHNIYAKKLGIPPVKVKIRRLENAGEFWHQKYATGENRSVILYDQRVLSLGPSSLIQTIIHETKHAQQSYNAHNFIKFGVFPKSDREKLLLLINFYRCEECYILPHFLKLEEIDAHVFDIYEMSKLNEKYPDKFNGYTYYRRSWAKIRNILYNCEYNKNGMDCWGLKLVYKAIKQDIYNTRKGYYGQDMKSLYEQIVCSGFNLEKAFASFIKDLDVMHESAVLLADNVRSLGLKAKFEKNGNLMYHPTKVSCINPLDVSSNLIKTFKAMSSEVDEKYYLEK